ncbi:MAG: crossover junction endodeoxyribonuclease RuvC [Gammaproteobacteria bacterium RIFCSPHIGHO2_12_FULL_41_15]|nr:MAG: crossover junction endodeoxyribonuclease RuvC [Gammaproteobacteria bacterium RIFCSPHIGHO2_12_FULL_41_15]
MPIILGIDPGSRTTGFGVIEHQGNRMTCITHGCIAVQEADLQQRLFQIFEAISNIIEQYKPQLAAIESVFINKNILSALKLGQARGAALAAMGKYALPTAEYSPREIKQATVGYGAADKKQVQHMIKVLLNLSETPQADAADALAIAICHAHCYKFKLKLENAK